MEYFFQFHIKKILIFRTSLTEIPTLPQFFESLTKFES